MEHGSLAARIERQIADEAGINVIAEETEGAIMLSGMVDSAEARQAAVDIATALAPDRRIEDNLDLEAITPATVDDVYADEPTTGDVPAGIGEARDLESLEPDFTDQPLLTNPIAAPGPSSGAPDLVEEGDEVYIPPTDPVVTADERGELEGLGGFAPTSMTDVAVEPSALDNRPGDEALADAIRRELREDAATTDLAIDVLVRQGVAHLRGVVRGPEDAESAEDVASRVPGVREVVDELEVPGL